MSDIQDRPQIGVSACLAKQAVRFDGCFIANKFVNDECTSFFDIHTVCPEVEMGLGVPRQVIQLRDFEGEIKLVYSKDPDRQITDSMREFSQRRLKSLPQLDGAGGTRHLQGAGAVGQFVRRAAGRPRAGEQGA